MRKSFELDECFAADFASAREMFRHSAAEFGGNITSYIHPTQRGPANEELATDVAVFGNPEADRMLVLVSGTHGVEGFCGSALQIAHLRSGILDELGSRVAIKLVHGLNPYGFAHKRRANEDNVDLNRNFVDFSGQMEPNLGYRNLHNVLTTPPTLPGRLKRKIALTTYILTKGKRHLQAAISNGQYEYPDGLFFGGIAPSWSSNTWKSILQNPVDANRRTLIIDYHTGLGEQGAAELISPGSTEGESWQSRAMAWFGEGVVRQLANRTTPAAGQSVSTDVNGDLLSYAISNAGTQVAAVFLEFGTVPAVAVLDALIDENWTNQSCPKSPNDTRCKEKLAQVFAIHPTVRPSVWKRAIETTTAALQGLSLN